MNLDGLTIDGNLLNIGSGPHYAEGWVNIDQADPPAGETPPDLKISVMQLHEHFPDGHFDRAYMGHFLEHVPWEELPDVGFELRRLVKPGGLVMAVGPCLWRALSTRQPVEILQAIVADPRHEAGPQHAWTPTEELTRVAMERMGFEAVITVPVQGITRPEWPNPTTALWQTAAQGRVPA